MLQWDASVDELGEAFKVRVTLVHSGHAGSPAVKL